MGLERILLFYCQVEMCRADGTQGSTYFSCPGINSGVRKQNRAYGSEV